MKATKRTESAPEITIREEWCKGCRFCVAYCPTQVLRMEGVKPVVAALEKCTACALCVWICPDFAIKVSE